MPVMAGLRMVEESGDGGEIGASFVVEHGGGVAQDMHVERRGSSPARLAVELEEPPDFVAGEGAIGGGGRSGRGGRGARRAWRGRRRR